MVPLPKPEVFRHLIDAHCHPTETFISDEEMEKLPLRVCAMSSHVDDQDMVHRLAETWPDKVIPCFGYHPWFSHRISLTHPPLLKLEHYAKILLDDPSKASDSPEFMNLLPSLPEPVSLSDILSTLRQNLLDFPHAFLGEVGLDRSFRIPNPIKGNEGPHPSKKLSPFAVPIEHQKTILEAQFSIAVELHRNISFHSVRAQNITLEFFREQSVKHGLNWDQISIDLHSCTLSPETWLSIEREHPNAFLSLSEVINSRSPAHEALIRAASPTRLLVESDYNAVSYFASQTWEMVLIVARLKGWKVEESEEEIVGDFEDDEKKGVIRRLEENWKRFEKGRHGEGKVPGRGPPKETKKARKRNKFPHAEEDWNIDGDDAGRIIQ